MSHFFFSGTPVHTLALRRAQATAQQINKWSNICWGHSADEMGECLDLWRGELQPSGIHLGICVFKSIVSMYFQYYRADT